MAHKLDYFINSNHGVKTIWIKNHSAKRAWFQSNDESLIKERIKGIEDDMTQFGRHEALLCLYRFAKNHGVTVLNKATGSTASGVLKIVPDLTKAPDGFMLLLARGRQEIILKRDSMSVCTASYKKLMHIKNNTNANILNETWEYAMAKQKLEVREIAQ